MKLVSFAENDRVSYGIWTENGVVDVFAASTELGEGHALPMDVRSGIVEGDGFLERIEEAWGAMDEEARERHTYGSDAIRLLPPLTSLGKNIMCVGKNYRDHAIEMGSEDAPENIMIFTKAPTTLAAPGEELPVHAELTEQLDYEGELAVVIGQGGRGIPVENAMDHVFGYTILNDITARDLQKKHGQFFLGKSLDATCPMGPYLVTKNEIDDPHDLSITTKVNGEVRQSSNTKNMMFKISDIISILSKGMTLEPGDVIATGTPAGVGKGFNPPKFLQGGDLVEIEVESVGKLTNRLQS
ncbi:fumarylacetoacetate hydrolase family protein [Rossellomorea marisflavi]|uniref:fumarylacetoacetate hydrolase family protein n=1 Tax=Rossellomorea marisflavi TaxID=189381 RepID=UPI0040444978